MSKTDKNRRYFQHAYKLRTSEQTKELYAKWAEVYDQEVDVEGGYRQPERCAKALADVMSDKSLPVLDVGCGTGLSGLALKQAGFESLVGCDLSIQMLEKAALTGCYGRLFETDLNQPPIPVLSASMLVGVFSFGHVAPSAIDEFLRILETGGKFVIGLNDHFYNEGTFPAKLDALRKSGNIAILSKHHGLHLKNVEDSTGWVISCKKI